jgi:hypothetical protein
MIRLLLLSSLTLFPASALAARSNNLFPPTPKNFQLDGFTFIDQEWTYSYPITQADFDRNGLAGMWPVTLDQNLPQIVAPKDAGTFTFNEAIKKYVAHIWPNSIRPGHTAPQHRNFTSVSLDFLPNEDALTGIISIKFSLGTDDHMGVHSGGTDNLNFNWNVAKHRPVTLSDIFKDPEAGQAAVGDIAANMFAKKFDYADDTSDSRFTASNIEPSVADPARWAILQSGIRIDTASEEVSVFTDGTPSVTVPWSALKPYLRPDGLVKP